MTKLVGSYSIRNLIQSTEFLLKITRSLNDEINNLEKIRDEVILKNFSKNAEILIEAIDTHQLAFLRIETSELDNL